ncbi:MAG: hypothetical protein A3E25_17930 [Burkholderiales bacterium RIFCSPHIGHO2_12_FULL_69_20]|nr:MAG: hypothetical protein A3E25_17930 [Burkholderiales bacterium RIFCSPHIGHO2_12_FULL_69_20]
MKTIYLSGQNNFGNRGCEALVRSTVGLLRQHLGGVRVLVPSVNASLDQAQWPDAAAHGVEFVPAGLPPAAWTQWDRLCRRVPLATHLPLFKLAPTPALQQSIARCDALLVIGGDNYSLDYDLSSLFQCVGEAELALSLGKKVVLWGASVGPFSRLPAIERRMVDHLKRLHLVTVRESASVDYLHGLGVAANVVPVADSAFLMRPQVDAVSTLPARAGRDVLGLNLSPLIDRILVRQGHPGLLRREGAAFVRQVVEEQGLDVLLIPHVVPLNGVGFGNDERTHAELMADLGDLGGALRTAPSGLNAPQLKHLISQCRFFIGARTHATIAAMSTGVPVGSIAYSLKARGINRDLFGHERYLLPTEQVAAGSLLELLATLRQDEALIRAQLAERLPIWRDRAQAGAQALARLMGDAGAHRP